MYNSPTPEQFRDFLKRHDLTGAQAAELVGVDSRTIRKWTASGDSANSRSMPWSAWALIQIAMKEMSLEDYFHVISVLKDRVICNNIANLLCQKLKDDFNFLQIVSASFFDHGFKLLINKEDVLMVELRRENSHKNETLMFDIFAFSLPENIRSKGIGSEIIETMINFSRKNKINSIKISDVLDAGMERFSIKHSFKKMYPVEDEGLNYILEIL